MLTFSFECVPSLNGSPCWVARWASWICSKTAVKALINNFHCSLHNSRPQTVYLDPEEEEWGQEEVRKNTESFKTEYVIPVLSDDLYLVKYVRWVLYGGRKQREGVKRRRDWWRDRCVSGSYRVTFSVANKGEMIHWVHHTTNTPLLYLSNCNI